MARAITPAADLMADGWLPTRAAADRLGITVGQLVRRAKRHEIRRRNIPGTSLFLYDVSDG